MTSTKVSSPAMTGENPRRTTAMESVARKTVHDVMSDAYDDGARGQLSAATLNCWRAGFDGHCGPLCDRLTAAFERDRQAGEAAVKVMRWALQLIESGETWMADGHVVCDPQAAARRALAEADRILREGA